MEWIINNKDLQALIAAPLSAAAKRSTIPMLSHLLITRKGGVIEVMGSNLEVQIKNSMPSDGADFAVSIDAAKLAAVAKSAPPGDIVIKYQDGQAAVKCGRSRYKLPALDTPDFPTIKENGTGTTVECRQRDLLTLLRRVSYAAGDNDIRHYMCGVMLHTADGKLNAVATDGHRMMVDAARVVGQWPGEIILPNKAVQEIVRHTKESEDLAMLTCFDRHVIVNLGSIELHCTLIDGKYPDWRRVVPPREGGTLTFERQAMLGMLERIQIVLDQKNNKCARFTLSADKITASGRGADSAIEDSISAGYNGEDLTMSFNPGYLKEMLLNMPDGELTGYFTTAERAALFVSQSAANLNAIVMPMRI